MENVGILKQALPYMKEHRGCTFVIKLGGEIVVDKENLQSLAQDIALAHHVGIKLVIVHGGGPQASDLSRRLGIEPQFVEGRRITDADTLEIAKMVFGGKINSDILSALRREGLHPVGFSGVSGNVIQADRRAPKEVVDRENGDVRLVDYGHVGDIRKVDTDLLTTLLAADYVPVLSSLGADSAGNVMNINADTVATAVAVELKADKLLVLTSVPGVLEDGNDPDSVISCLSASEAEALVASGAVAGGMIPKVTNLIDAVRSGIARTHILSGTTTNCLLIELFTKDGSGTMITLKAEQKRYLSE